jgi:O-antigen/teichoic acid export membrane protein
MPSFHDGYEQGMRGPIARGTLRTTMVLGLRLFVQAGTLLLMARFLSPDQFGAFAGVAALAVTLGTLATFGTHIVLLGETAKAPERREQVLSYSVPSTLACGATLLVAYLLICKFALHEANIPSTAIIAIGLAETLLQPLLSLPAMEHLALGHVARSQMLQTLPLVLRLGVAAIVLLTHPAEPLDAYGYGYFAASAIALGVSVFGMPAPWPSVRAWRFPTRAELRETTGFAVLNITAITPAELDKTLAAKFLPLHAAGLYSAGARVIGAATLPVIAMMLSALPRLFRENQDQSHRALNLLRWMISAALIYSFVLATVIWFIAPVFVPVFGDKYQGIQQAVRWLCPAVPFMALRMVAGNILLTIGKPWMRVLFEALGMIVLTICAAILPGHFGIIGMPLALAFSECTMAVVGFTIILKERGQLLSLRYLN